MPGRERRRTLLTRLVMMTIKRRDVMAPAAETSGKTERNDEG